MTTKFKKPSQIRSFLRDKCESLTGITRYNNNVPIYVIDGDQPPKAYGSKGGWFTRGGSRIDHPGSYAKSGWSNMVYRTDGRKIKVGKEWLKNNNICPLLVDC